MQSEEQRLIDGLFSRLKEAEAHSASRDASAEERIAQHVSAAGGPYMAQTILIRKPRLNSLTIASGAGESGQPTAGGKAQQRWLLSGLFGGGGSSRGSDPIPGAEQYGRPQASAQPQYTPPPQQNYAPQCRTRRRLYGGRAANGRWRGRRRGAGQYADQYVQRLAPAGDSQYHRRSRSLMPPPRRTASRRTPPQVTIRSAGDDQFLADNTGTTTSTPALATMILAAMTIAGFNPATLNRQQPLLQLGGNCCRSRCDKLSGPPV